VEVPQGHRGNLYLQYLAWLTIILGKAVLLIIQASQKQSRSMIRAYACRLYSNLYNQGRIKIAQLLVMQDKLVQNCVWISKTASHQVQQKEQIRHQKSRGKFIYQIHLSVIQSQLVSLHPVIIRNYIIATRQLPM